MSSPLFAVLLASAVASSVNVVADSHDLHASSHGSQTSAVHEFAPPIQQNYHMRRVVKVDRLDSQNSIMPWTVAECRIETPCMVVEGYRIRPETSRSKLLQGSPAMPLACSKAFDAIYSAL